MEDLLAKYEAYHRNTWNKVTHYIGIPLIIFSLFLPLQWLRFDILSYSFSFADVFFVLTLIYYLKLNIALAAGMFLTVGLILYCSLYFSAFENSGIIASLTFAAGWGFQFAGHYFEGKQPAFFTSLIQLLIGPLYLLAKFYFKLGFLKNKEKIILEKSFNY